SAPTRDHPSSPTRRSSDLLELRRRLNGNRLCRNPRVRNSRVVHSRADGEGQRVTAADCNLSADCDCDQSASSLERQFHFQSFFASSGPAGYVYSVGQWWNHTVYLQLDFRRWVNWNRTIYNPHLFIARNLHRDADGQGQQHVSTGD